MHRFLSYSSHVLPTDAARYRRERGRTPDLHDPARHARSQRGTVYLVGASDGPVKIGHTTKTVEERIAALQIGSPLRLLLLDDFEGTPTDERRLHKELDAYRLHGEWFMRANRVFAAFDEARP